MAKPKRWIAPESPDRHPVYFSRAGIGPEKYPLTDEERAKQVATRLGGHAKFVSRSKFTGQPVRAWDRIVGVIHPCQKCFSPFYDERGDQFCDQCR